jgi:hypothetical protein
VVNFGLDPPAGTANFHWRRELSERQLLVEPSPAHGRAAKNFRQGDQSFGRSVLLLGESIQVAPVRVERAGLLSRVWGFVEATPKETRGAQHGAKYVYSGSDGLCRVCVANYIRKQPRRKMDGGESSKIRVSDLCYPRRRRPLNGMTLLGLTVPKRGAP